MGSANLATRCVVTVIQENEETNTILERIRKDICAVWIEDGGNYVRFSCDEAGVVRSTDDERYNLFDLGEQWEFRSRLFGRIGRSVFAQYEKEWTALWMRSRGSERPDPPDQVALDLRFNEERNNNLANLLKFIVLIDDFYAKCRRARRA